MYALSLTPDDDSVEFGLDTPSSSLMFWELLMPIPTTTLYRSDTTNLLNWPGVGNNGSLVQSSGARCVHKEKLVWNTKLKCFQHEEKLVWNTKMSFQHSLKPVKQKLNPCLKHKVEVFSAQSQTCLISSENLSKHKVKTFLAQSQTCLISSKNLSESQVEEFSAQSQTCLTQSETLSTTSIRATVKQNSDTLSICTTLKGKLFYFYYCSNVIQACFLKKIQFIKKYTCHFCPAVVFWSLKCWLTISVCPNWLGNAT